MLAGIAADADERVAHVERLLARELEAPSTARAPPPAVASAGADAIASAAHCARSRNSAQRHDLGHEPDLVRALRRHALVIAEQRDPHDLVERHLLHDVDRLEHRRHAVGDVRVEERRVLGRDDELDLAEHVERAAARDAVHRRDHRLPQVARLRADLLAGIVEHPRRASGSRCPLRLLLGVGVAVAHRLHAVDPGAERTLAGTRQHDAA